jgi:hypothetical protein
MWKVLVTVVFVLSSAGVALGGDSDSAREHFVKGTRAYDLGLYDEAIAEYMTAYKIKDDPAFLFNIGQAHRLAGHPAEALRFYKTYLSKIPTATNRAEVETKMSELTKHIEQQKQSAPQPAPAPPPGSRTAAAQPVEASPASAPSNAASALNSASAEITQTSPGEAPRAGRGKRVAGIASAAGGLALVGAGIALGVLAKRAGEQLTQLDEDKGVFDPSKESAGRRDQVLSVVFVSVGAAAVATGAILYVLGIRSDQETSQAFVISPSFAGHSAGATFQMVF